MRTTSGELAERPRRSCAQICSTSGRSRRRSGRTRPHEVYNLAAPSFVPRSWDEPVLTAEFAAVGVTVDAGGDP